MTASQILDMIAPQFATDPNKANFISLAQNRTNKDFYGNNYEHAVALLAAHMMTLAERSGGEGGAISSKREGDLAVSFAVSSGATGFDSTSFGQELKQLRKEAGPFIAVTGGNDVGY